MLVSMNLVRWCGLALVVALSTLVLGAARREGPTLVIQNVTIIDANGAPPKPLPLPGAAAATVSRSAGVAGATATVDGRCTHAASSRVQSVREWTNIVPPPRGLTRLSTPVGSAVHVAP